MATLTKIRAKREEQAAILQMHPHAEHTIEPEADTCYLPCPTCGNLMNRVNFASSNVIVDICKQHGTWFDKDELTRIIEFIRAGGIDSARRREREEIEETRQHSTTATMTEYWDPAAVLPQKYDGWNIAIDIGAAVLRGLWKIK